jgi:hypothetical protein
MTSYALDGWDGTTRTTWLTVAKPPGTRVRCVCTPDEWNMVTLGVPQ